MRLPWSKTNESKSTDPGPVSKSQAALSGPEGDGKDHDLQYWIASGFLTLPAGAFDTPAKTKATTTETETPAPGPAK